MIEKNLPSTDSLWKKFSLKEKVEAIKKHYKEQLQGKCVINQDLGISVQFTSDGLGKITQNRKIGNTNAEAVRILEQIIEQAKYNNFGERKESDKENVLGFLNFKGKAVIDNTLCHFRIAIKRKTDGNTFYNHTLNRQKK